MAGKENAVPQMMDESINKSKSKKKKIFATPIAKLNRSIVRVGATRRNTSQRATGNTSIVYKQTLKANNANLAKALDMAKQDLAVLAKKILELEKDKQQQTAKISVLRRLTNESNDAIEAEIQKRIQLRMERLRVKLESTANLLHMAGDELHEVLVLCDNQKVKDIDEIVKDTLELTQMISSNNIDPTDRTRRPRSIYPTTNASTGLTNMLTEIDDSESRLSIVRESGELRRKSSIQPGHHSRDDPSSIPVEVIDSAPITSRSKSRRFRGSTAADEDSEQSEVDIPGVTRRRRTHSSGRLSTGITSCTHSAGVENQPLETVFSAAANTQSISSPEATSPDCATVAELSPALPEDASVPFDEIPVGSRKAREQALKEMKLERATQSRSRRQTTMIRHNTASSIEDTNNLLSQETTKFYCYFSPPRVFNEQKAPEKGKNTLERTFCVESHVQASILAEQSSLLIQSDGDADQTYVKENSLHGNDQVVSPAYSHQVAEDEAGEVESVDGNSTLVNSNEQEEGEGPVVEKPGEVQMEEMEGEKIEDGIEMEVEKPGATRQMEIQCNAGQFKVKVGSRDGGPARTKGKKKDKQRQPQQQMDDSSKPKFRDPFDMSLSETFIDPQAVLMKLKETERERKTDSAQAAEKSTKLENKVSEAVKKKSRRAKKKVKDEEVEQSDKGVVSEPLPNQQRARTRRRARINYIEADSSLVEPTHVTKEEGTVHARVDIADRKELDAAQASIDIEHGVSHGEHPGINGTETGKKAKRRRGRKVEGSKQESKVPNDGQESNKTSVSSHKSGQAKNSKSAKVGYVDTDANTDTFFADKESESKYDAKSSPEKAVTPAQSTSSVSVQIKRTPQLMTATETLALLSDSDDEIIIPVTRRRKRVQRLDDSLNSLNSSVGTDSKSQKASTEMTAKPNIESPPKRMRRAAANINFKEPSLHGKLRKGDPGTSTLYLSMKDKK